MVTPSVATGAVPTTPRPALAFLMASLLTSYPDASCVHGLKSLCSEAQLDASCAGTDRDGWQRLRAHIAAVLSSAAALETLRAEYLALFEYGPEHASLYETAYGRAQALHKGPALADIAGFYRAFGLAYGQTDSVQEMPDHLSVELEFYALLLMKQEVLAARGDAEGQQIVLAARRTFLEAHLGRFVPLIATHPGVTASAFYGPVLAWCREVVAAECARLGLALRPADDLRTYVEPEEMGCGSHCAVLAGTSQRARGAHQRCGANQPLQDGSHPCSLLRQE